METVEKVAAYVARHYKELFAQPIDEMKLHKLLYFAQRESYVLFDRPLFKGTFVAGIYGPIVISIRNLYKENNWPEEPSKEWIAENQAVMNRVFDYYAKKSSWSLSSLTHGEISWKNARDRGDHDAMNYQPLTEDDIRLDARKVQLRRNFLKQSNASLDANFGR
jgi:uncharacterized phage-associated protein